MTSRAIAVTELELDDACQTRAALDEETLEEYREFYKSEANMPPVDVAEVEGRLILFDGFHRFTAAKQIGKGFIRANVVEKDSIDEARWAALAANKTHGLKRTNADKHRAVLLALESPIGQEQSSRTIAEHVGVSPDFVSRLRKEWEAEQREKHAAATSNANDVDPVSSDDSRSQVTETTAESDRGFLKKGSNSTRKHTPNKHKAEPNKGGRPPEPLPKTAEPMPPEREALAECAKILSAARREFKAAWPKSRPESFTQIEPKLRAVWRSVDWLVPVICEQCGGSGCKWCQGRGWNTKGDESGVRDKLRGLRKAGRL